MTCRNSSDDIKTEESRYLGISLGEELLTAQAVYGMEVARAWLRLQLKLPGAEYRGEAQGRTAV